MFGVALSLSIAGLLIGPAITSWAHGRMSALRVIDAAMLGVVLPLLLLRLVPHLVDEIGVLALAGVAGGYFVFAAIEGRTHNRATQLGVAILLPTLAIHSFLDGAALAVAFQRGASDAAGATLGAALVLHRVPEGLVLAAALVPRLGFRGTMIRVAALGAMTLLGGLIGRELLAHAPDRALHVIVAIGLGVMLRMIVHSHHHQDEGHPAEDRARWAEGFAFLLAATISIAIPSPLQLFEQSQPAELSAAQAIVPLFVETAPWILGALLLGELLSRGAPARSTESWPAAWLAVGILAFVWLGLDVALAVVVLGPLARLSNRRPDDERSTVRVLRSIVPRPRAILPSYAAGIAIALVVEAAVPAHELRTSAMVAIPLGAAVGWVFPMGAVGALPIAAIAVHKGIPASAALAFIVVHILAASRRRGDSRWRQAIAVAVTIAVAAALTPVLGTTPSLHELGHHLPPLIEQISAIIVAGWVVLELARRGPRPFLEAIR